MGNIRFPDLPSSFVDSIGLSDRVIVAVVLSGTSLPSDRVPIPSDTSFVWLANDFTVRVLDVRISDSGNSLRVEVCEIENKMAVTSKVTDGYIGMVNF